MTVRGAMQNGGSVEQGLFLALVFGKGVDDF